MSNVWIKEDVRIEEPNLSKQGSRIYLSPVEACLETLMTYGRDRYGARHTPILVSILDIEREIERYLSTPLFPRGLIEINGKFPWIALVLVLSFYSLIPHLFLTQFSI